MAVEITNLGKKLEIKGKKEISLAEFILISSSMTIYAK